MGAESAFDKHFAYRQATMLVSSAGPQVAFWALGSTNEWARLRRFGVVTTATGCESVSATRSLKFEPHPLERTIDEQMERWANENVEASDSRELWPHDPRSLR